MLMPYRTLPDPEVQGEGSLDPLGLASAADRLAEWMLPGMTARMWRPRFLTAMAATAPVVQPFEDEIARDGVSPPWVVLEWYYVEALARIGRGGEADLRRVPGIDKARRAQRDGVPLSADRYLKMAKVFGFHGVYKRLARNLDVADDNLALGENGFRLLRIWEDEQGLSGFSDPEHNEGDPARLRRILLDAVREGLATGQTARQGAWAGYEFFTSRLAPSRIGSREAGFLWDRLIDMEADPRGEVFQLLRDSENRRVLSAEKSERTMLLHLRPRMSGNLRLRADAIEALESVCRPLQEAWDRLCCLSTRLRPSPVRDGDMARDPRFSEIAGSISGDFSRARPMLAESPALDGFEALARDFDEVRTGAALFRTLWERHLAVQRQKPPDGKRPWFEATDDGGLVVRPPYRLDDAPVRQEFVHPYRLLNVAAFIDDLSGAD